MCVCVCVVFEGEQPPSFVQDKMLQPTTQQKIYIVSKRRFLSFSSLFLSSFREIKYTYGFIDPFFCVHGQILIEMLDILFAI